MSEYEPEEYALGFNDCACHTLGAEADGQPCTSCGERVKYVDHVHFKGGLFHEWCLLIAALREAAKK